jgi:hypothetical protein
VSKAALGFSVHTGWAAAVTIAGTPDAVSVVDRRRVDLLEPGVPWEVYHAAGRGRPGGAERLIERAKESALRLATDALEAITEELRTAGRDLVASGVVLSGARPLLTVQEALATHAAKHSAEGQLYRQALLDASRALALHVVALPLRELEDAAVAQLRRPPHQVRGRISELGRDLGPPWTADQKHAALIAWLALATAPAPRACRAAKGR